MFADGAFNVHTETAWIACTAIICIAAVLIALIVIYWNK